MNPLPFNFVRFGPVETMWGENPQMFKSIVLTSQQASDRAIES